MSMVAQGGRKSQEYKPERVERASRVASWVFHKVMRNWVKTEVMRNTMKIEEVRA